MKPIPHTPDDRDFPWQAGIGLVAVIVLVIICATVPPSEAQRVGQALFEVIGGAVLLGAAVIGLVMLWQERDAP